MINLPLNSRANEPNIPATRADVFTKKTRKISMTEFERIFILIKIEFWKTNGEQIKIPFRTGFVNIILISSDDSLDLVDAIVWRAFLN